MVSISTIRWEPRRGDVSSSSSQSDDDPREAEIALDPPDRLKGFAGGGLVGAQLAHAEELRDLDETDGPSSA
jgi:hypothetical protein